MDEIQANSWKEKNRLRLHNTNLVLEVDEGFDQFKELCNLPSHHLTLINFDESFNIKNNA